MVKGHAFSTQMYGINQEFGGKTAWIVILKQIALEVCNRQYLVCLNTNDIVSAQSQCVKTAANKKNGYIRRKKNP